MATRQDLQNLITSGFTLQTPKPQQTSGVSVSMDTNIGDIINSESTEKRNMKISDQMNKLLQKHQVRMNMAGGRLSSGDKRMDKLEDARSSLADYARSAYLEEAKKDSSMDLGVLENMKDGDIIDWMTKDDPEAKQKFVNFVNNGGFVKDVYNDIMGISEEATREQERQEAGWLKNLVGAGMTEIPSQIAGFMDITGITDKINQKDLERLDKYNQVSSDEYNKFKSGEVSFDELKDKGVSGIYYDYEDDVNNGRFFGSIEDYGKAMYNKGKEKYSQSMQEQILNNSLLQYDPEGKGAGLGKFIAQLEEFGGANALAKNIIGQLGMAGLEGNFLYNTLTSTAEILGMNALSEGKLPTKGEAAATAGVTALLEGIIRVPGGIKMVRDFIGKATPEVKKALNNTTREQFSEYGQIAKQGLSAAKKKGTEILDKAATGIREKIENAGKKLGKIRENMEGDFKFQDFFDNINAEFKKFEEKGRGPNSAPEIKINKNGQMEIYNEEALSNVTDTEGIKLLDYIKSEWNAFRNQNRADDIKNAERFMQDINDKIWKAINEGKINRGDSAVGALLDAIKGGYEKLYGKMGTLGQDFKNAKEEFSNLDNYAKFFEKYIGKLKEGKKGTQALNELEREMQLGEKGFGKGGDYIGEFLNILKDNDIIKEDLGSQLISLVYSFGLKNPRQLQELIDTIYPSIPGVREVVLSLVRRGLKGSAAETMLKDAVPGKLDIWQNINNALRPATQVGEERMLEY